MAAGNRPHPDPYRGDFSEELKPGTSLLHGQYTIESYLGAGGFALTYLARDSLERPVVLKECFPGSLCVRNNQSVRAKSHSRQDELSKIVRLFFREAQRLAKLRHPNIVGVHQVFECNGTAYMALDYIEGPDLMNIIEDERGAIDIEQLRSILVKLLDAIAYVHDENILHRDISPDNILLDKMDTPVLIDFGAAREQATRASRVLSSLQVVKDGYSPQEFYVAGAQQGPPGDLYALGATFYHLLTGEAPPNSQIRLAAIAGKEPDPYRPLLGNMEGVDRIFLASIDKALNVFPKERHQCAREWLHCLDERKRRAAALAEARRDAEIENAISKLVVETNEAVVKAIKEDKPKVREKPAEQKRKKPFFPWQTEEDWLNRGESERPPELKPVNDGRSAVMRRVKVDPEARSEAKPKARPKVLRPGAAKPTQTKKPAQTKSKAGTEPVVESLPPFLERKSEKQAGKPEAQGSIRFLGSLNQAFRARFLAPKGPGAKQQ